MNRIAAIVCVTALSAAFTSTPSAHAASPTATFAAVVTSARTPTPDGCFDIRSLSLSASNSATETSLFVSIDQLRQCGNIFTSVFRADVPGVPVTADALSIRGSTRGFGIHATVPATIFDGVTDFESTVRVDIDIDNPPQPDPRLNGNFAATASGTVSGAANVNLAGTVWTGLPVPGQLDYAAATVVKVAAHGETGPSPITWPDWRKQPSSSAATDCGATLSGSIAQFNSTVWASNGRLNGFSIQVPSDCVGSAELSLSSFDALQPDGSLDPAKTVVIRALPGTDFFAGPSTVASLGLTGTTVDLSGIGGPIAGVPLCAGSASTTDFVIDNNQIVATAC